MTSSTSSWVAIWRAAGPSRSGEDGVVDDPALLEQLGPDRLREGEVGGVVAVEVADLAPAVAERELAAATGTRLDAWPARDRLR